MYYYILDNKKVINFDHQPDLEIFSQLQELTEAQVEFYLANPTASIQEIRDCALRSNVNQSTLEDNKEAIINEMSSYSLHISEQIVPDYKIRNAQISLLESENAIYSQETAHSVISRANLIGKQCRDLFYQFRSQIDKAKDQAEIDAIYNETLTIYDNLVNNEKTT